MAARRMPSRVVTVHPAAHEPEGTCGVELRGPGPGRDVRDRRGLMGVSPSPKAFVNGPPGPNRRTLGFRPGSDGVALGATRGLPPMCSAQGYCAAPA